MSEFITNGELRMEAERLCDENERLETENAKLRLQIHWLKKGDVHAYEAGYHDGATNYELDHCPSCKNIADLQDALDENAKLRELAAEMYPYAKAFLQQGVMLGCNDSKSYDWFLQLRELGVVVE